MKRTEESLDSKQVLSVIEKYNTALDLLDAYDHQNMVRPKGNEATYVLTLWSRTIAFWMETNGLRRQCFSIFWIRIMRCLQMGRS